MSRFNVYELLDRLADAVTKTRTPPDADAPSAPAAPIGTPAPTPFPAREKPTKKELAVVEMLRNHDKKSREIDEKIAAAKDDRAQNEETP